MISIFESAMYVIYVHVGAWMRGAGITVHIDMISTKSTFCFLG